MWIVLRFHLWWVCANITIRIYLCSAFQAAREWEAWETVTLLASTWTRPTTWFLDSGKYSFVASSWTATDCSCSGLECVFSIEPTVKCRTDWFQSLSNTAKCVIISCVAVNSWKTSWEVSSASNNKPMVEVQWDVEWVFHTCSYSSTAGWGRNRFPTRMHEQRSDHFIFILLVFNNCNTIIMQVLYKHKILKYILVWSLGMYEIWYFIEPGK